MFTLHWGLGEESGLQQEGMRQADCSHRKSSKKVLTKLLLLGNTVIPVASHRKREGRREGEGC